MRVLRWLRSIGRALSLAIVVLSVLYLLLQTTIGRGWMTALIEGAASSPGQSVTIKGLDGRLPDAPHVGRVFVSDSKGTWLELHDVTLEWSPLALLRGRTIVDSLTARRVEWRRQPEPAAADKSSSGDGGLSKLAIRNLEITELSIAPEVAGRGGVFGVNGSADLLDPATRMQLNLSVVEKSDAGAHVQLALDYEPAANRLDASSNIADRAGGTITAMLEFPPDAPLTIALQSSGPLDSWRAKLTGTGGAALNMQGQATIDRRGDWREATLSLASTIGAIGPERLRALYVGASTIGIAAAQSDNGAWRIDRLKAQTPALSAAGHGVFDVAQQRAAGELSLRAPNGDAFSALTGNARWKDLNVAAKLQGGWPKPTLLIDATAADIAHSDISASNLNAHIEAQPDRPWNDEEARIALTSRAAATGMRAADPTLNQALANGATMTLQGTLVDRARLANVASELTLAGANGMVISNVANGLIAAGSREAVNGGQLHAVQQQLNGRMDGLEQRVDGQPQSRALAAASAAPTEQVTPTPEASDSPQVASAGEGTSPAPQPKSKKDDTPSPTPQVDTAELEKMLARANEYTDGAISNFERRLDKMDKRFNRMAAMSSAQTAMAMNTAGLATYNRLGAGVGYAEGESAMAVGYQRVLNEKGSATFSLNGAFTNSGERSMGVGVGIGW